jgi:cytochrome c553
MRIVIWVMAGVLAQQLAASAGALTARQPAPAGKATLDFDYFKTQVQPVFLTKRAGYTRCVVCHAGGEAGFLQPLAPGATDWTEEQSRKNFEAVSRLVVPGQPMKSRLLTHPLEPKAGGDEFHNGGRQFTSQEDPQFRTIAAWVAGKTAGGGDK